jgi:hypothetical protein
MDGGSDETILQALYRHNRESQTAAIEILRDRRRGFLQNLRGCWDADPNIRRESRLRVTLGVPGVVRLFYRYILRGGFIGSCSFDRAALQATREHWIEMKVREHEKPWRKKADALVERLLRERAHE